MCLPSARHMFLHDLLCSERLERLVVCDLQLFIKWCPVFSVLVDKVGNCIIFRFCSEFKSCVYSSLLWPFKVCILSAHTFHGNQTHVFGVARAILYFLSTNTAHFHTLNMHLSMQIHVFSWGNMTYRGEIRQLFCWAALVGCFEHLGDHW